MSRDRLLVAMIALIPLGIATKLYRGPGAGWVNSSAGGVLYVTFWSLLVLFIRPRLSPWIAGGAVLGVTAGLEVLQLWHPPFLEAVRATVPGRALIGTTFSWLDFPHYLAGMLLTVPLTRVLEAADASSCRSRAVG
jgi:hypothetical protein